MQQLVVQFENLLSCNQWHWHITALHAHAAAKTLTRAHHIMLWLELNSTFSSQKNLNLDPINSRPMVVSLMDTTFYHDGMNNIITGVLLAL